MAKNLDYPEPFPLDDAPTPDQSKMYSAIISIKQEEYIHQNGNPKDLVKFEDCLSWKELTSSIGKDRCSNKCLPVILKGLFGQRNDFPKCHDPIEHQCMMFASTETLVRIKKGTYSIPHCYFIRLNPKKMRPL